MSENKKKYDFNAFLKLIEYKDIEEIYRIIKPRIYNYALRTNIPFDEIDQQCLIKIWEVIERGHMVLKIEYDENGVPKKGFNPRNYITYACIFGIKDMLKKIYSDKKINDMIMEEAKHQSSKYQINKNDDEVDYMDWIAEEES